MSTHDRPAGIPDRYEVVGGDYDGTTDNVAGTWYVVDTESAIIDKRGRGYRTRREAWETFQEDLEAGEGSSES